VWKFLVNSLGFPAVFMTGLPAVLFIRRLSYPPSLWRSGGVADWQTVLGKSACCKEKCKAIIIRDADKALHLVFPGTLTDLT